LRKREGSAPGRKPAALVWGRACKPAGNGITWRIKSRLRVG
jgi:hypothetical protein